MRRNGAGQAAHPYSLRAGSDPRSASRGSAAGLGPTRAPRHAAEGKVTAPTPSPERTAERQTSAPAAGGAPAA